MSEPFPEPRKLSKPEYGLMLNIDEMEVLDALLSKSTQYDLAGGIEGKLLPLLKMARRDAGEIDV